MDARIKRAHYILITHGHRDHMIDAPYIATKTRAYVIGTETIANLARAYSVPEQQLLIVRGGEDYDFGPFSLKLIPSLHSATYGKRFYSEPIASTAPRGLKAPLRWPDFVHGGELAYLLRMAGHEVLIMGGGNYIEREMEGLRPDVALVGADAARKEIYDYAGRLMRALGYPPVVFPTHTPGRWDETEQQNIEEFLLAVGHGIHRATPTQRQGDREVSDGGTKARGGVESSHSPSMSTPYRTPRQRPGHGQVPGIRARLAACYRSPADQSANRRHAVAGVAWTPIRRSCRAMNRQYTCRLACWSFRSSECGKSR